MTEAHARMHQELRALVRKWKSEGQESPMLLAFLMKTIMDTSEAAGVDYEVARSVVDNAYGRNNFDRPTVKA